MTREEMLAEVYTAHYPLFRFLAARIVGTEDSLDVIQTAFLRVLKGRRDFSDAASACRYVKRAVVNTALDLAKKKGKWRRLEVEDASETADRRSSTVPTPLALLLGGEQERDRECLARKLLPAAERLCLEKRVPLEMVQNKRRGQLTAWSRRQGVPISTLRSRQSAVVRDLRKHFE